MLGSFPHNTFFSNKILNISWIFSGNQLHYHLLYRSLNIRGIYLVEFKLAMWEMNQGSKQNHHTKISGNQDSNQGQWTPAHDQYSTLSILQLTRLTVINLSGIFCLSTHITVWVLRFFKKFCVVTFHLWYNFLHLPVFKESAGWDSDIYPQQAVDWTSKSYHFLKPRNTTNNWKNNENKYKPLV